MVDRGSAAREDRMAEGSVYDVKKQAWDEARVKGNKYHQSGDGQFPISDTLVTSQMSRDIVARH